MMNQKKKMICHLYDNVYANGKYQTLMEKCNSKYSEFELLWHHCCTILTQQLTIGQDKKITPKDIWFIVLCVLRAATNLDLIDGTERTYTLDAFFMCCWDFESFSVWEYMNNYVKFSMRTLLKIRHDSMTFTASSIPPM